MFHWRWASGLLVLGLFLLAASESRAERVPSARVPTLPTPGARPDGRVPYTTNGYSTLGVYDGVAPRIYASPMVSDPRNVGVVPVYNLPFYGGVQAFGSQSNGATPRPPVNIRPR
jgi:hypothetical protein